MVSKQFGRLFLTNPLRKYSEVSIIPLDDWKQSGFWELQSDIAVGVFRGSLPRICKGTLNSLGNQSQNSVVSLRLQVVKRRGGGGGGGTASKFRRR